MSRARELLAVLMGTQAGGFLAQPPGLDGEPGLGLAGVSGVPRARRWDAIASARAPELTGDSVTFVTLEDGTIVVEDDVPDNSLAPLADAIEEALPPPYRAAGVRNDGDVWSIAGESIVIVELRTVEGDVVDLSVVAGIRELTIDGERTIRPLPALDTLFEAHRDIAIHGERVDDDLFAVDVFPL